MKHEALKELRDLIKLPDWNTVCPEKNRLEQLEYWFDRWIVEAEYSQSVVDTKYLTSEFNDVIKLKLAQSLGEESLAENCISYKTQEKKITASMCSLRRKAKK